MSGDVADLPSVLHARERITEAIVLLRDGGNHGWAERLDELRHGMDSRYATKEALHTIGALCHPKALGEATPQGGDRAAWDRWHSFVAELEQACARAFRELEGPPWSGGPQDGSSSLA